jgi:hypothetical protein
LPCEQGVLRRTEQRLSGSISVVARLSQRRAKKLGQDIGGVVAHGDGELKLNRVHGGCLR